jgi:hypothetical protein
MQAEIERDMKLWDVRQLASSHAPICGLGSRFAITTAVDTIVRRARVLTSSVEARAIKGRPDMTSLIPESIFIWVSLVGTLGPPRDPNDDDVEKEEEDDHEADEDREPAVIREPDEDE